MKLKIVSFLLMLFCVTQYAMALNPSKEYKNKPEKFGMQYKEEKVATKDGATLNAWFFELPKKTTNWIVISNSGDGNMSDDIEKAGQFMSAGWNVCMYDYRGYGASSDFAIDADLYIYPQFVNDLNAVLDYLRKSRAITKFDLFGTNIGAGLSIGVGISRPETRKIIADGTWINLEFMKKKFKEKKRKDVNLPFGFDKMIEPQYACDRQHPHIKGIMVIVSATDDMVGPQDIRMLKGINDTYIVKSATNNSENFSSDKDVYFKRVSSFLNQ